MFKTIVNGQKGDALDFSIDSGDGKLVLICEDGTRLHCKLHCGGVLRFVNAEGNVNYQVLNGITVLKEE